MGIVQLVTALEKYSVDILCLGFLVCGLTSIIKRFVPASGKKYLTFVPFVVGILAYGIYILVTVGFDAVWNIKVLENGFQCGMMSTIYYVLFEQFIRGKDKYAKTDDPRELTVAGQIEGIVLDSYLKTLPKQIVTGVERHLGDTTYCEDYILSVFVGKLKPAVDEREALQVARLVVTSVQLLTNEKLFKA